MYCVKTLKRQRESACICSSLVSKRSGKIRKKWTYERSRACWRLVGELSSVRKKGKSSTIWIQVGDCLFVFCVLMANSTTLLTSIARFSKKEYSFSTRQSLFSKCTQLFVLAASKELCRSVTICIIQQVLLALQCMSNTKSTRWNEDKSNRLDGEWGRQREGRTGRERRAKTTWEPGLNSDAECNSLLSLLYATLTEQCCVLESELMHQLMVGTQLLLILLNLENKRHFFNHRAETVCSSIQHTYFLYLCGYFLVSKLTGSTDNSQKLLNGFISIQPSFIHTARESGRNLFQQRKLNLTRQYKQNSKSKYHIEAYEIKRAGQGRGATLKGQFFKITGLLFVLVLRNYRHRCQHS